jgi:diguanylate cyclase (GGDEF)-like protein
MVLATLASRDNARDTRNRSDLERENRELRERVALLEEVVNNFPGGIVLTDRDLKVVLCNKQQSELLEYPDSLFENGTPTLQQIFRFNAERGEYGPGDVDDHVAYKMDLVRKRIPHVFERTRPNGVIVEIRGRPISGGGFVTSYTDVTENRRQAALVARLAMHDPLTGLGNRNLFAERFEHLAARARRGMGFALHIIDLDRFKPINDRFGHAVGDKVLVEMARRIQASVRETDTAVRLGGDEFVILQADVESFDGAREMGRRLMAQLQEPIVIAGAILQVGACIGIALSSRDCLSMDDLLRKADMALYACKKSGGDSFQINQCALGDACPLHSGTCAC